MEATSHLIRLPVPAPTSAVFATLLFTDIVGSTRHAVELGDPAWTEVLASHDRVVREEVALTGGRVIKSMGDGYFVAFDDARLAIECAHTLVAAARSVGLEIRAGLHSGPCQVLGDDLVGVAVNIAARVCSLADGGTVLATSAVAEPAGDDCVEMLYRGLEKLRDIPGKFRLFEPLPCAAVAA